MSQQSVREGFFALCRNKSALQKELRSCLANPEHRFGWEQGEFCAILHEAASLVFGRDVFGRKSLCWRIVPQEGGGGSARFQLSTFPRRVNQNEAEWHEVPPGNIVVLGLHSVSDLKIVDTSSKEGRPFCQPKPLFDFNFMLNSLSQFIAQPILVHSYYPPNQFEADPLFALFKKTSFVEARGSDILLSPSDSPQIELGDTMVSTLTAEFMQRFFSALEGILRHIYGSDPSLSQLRVPVLFSGGVDSLMVALTAGEVLNKWRLEKGLGHDGMAGAISLFTVAFGEKPEGFSEASDRFHSIAAYQFLKRRSLETYGFNLYTLVLINVLKEELHECRQNSIAEAIAPSNTVLDDSIGCVVWFASRMQGVLYESGEPISDITPFALVGSGSDEQLGGYARHKTVFERAGLKGLAEELSMEMHRIGARNFGRDDRVGMSNGKALLAPFLEEPLVHWLNCLPTALKTGYSLAQHNKFLLRNALRSMGVPEHIVQRPKRAMQFGTRIAKLESKKGVKGSHVCERLMSNGEKDRTTPETTIEC